jgi:hypothetical protein
MRAVWSAALIFIVALVLGLEAFALLTDRLTLSRFIWNISEAWPLFIFLCGFVTGGLAVHFWWHWNPKETRA